MANVKVGTVTHFFDKIQVAVVSLIGDLNIGDQITFNRGGEEVLKQTVESIQVEHNKIDHAKGGMEVGLKVEGIVREGSEVYKAI